MALIRFNGADLASFGGRLLRPTLIVRKTVREPDSASFAITGYKPEALSEVLILNEAGSEKVFGGIVTDVRSIRVGRGADFEADYAVTCGGFSHLLQRHRLQRRFDAGKAGAIIQAAVAEHCPEIDTTNVQAGPDLPVIAWTDYPLTLIQRLAELTGFVWWVDADKRLHFEARGDALAPADLSDTSRNFDELEITYDAKTVRNAVTVRGGTVPSGNLQEDRFTGAAGVGNFKLSYQPFGNARNPLLIDTFSPQGNYRPDGNLWLEFDVSNPTPPNQADTGKPPIIDIDGFIIVDNFGSPTAACRFTGGVGNWGEVGILARKGFDRQTDRYLWGHLQAHTAGDWLIGWFDGLGIDVSDCRHGLLFKANGTIARIEAGVETATGQSYSLNTDYSVRLTLSAAGCRYEIIGGTFGAWSGRTWTGLATTATDTTPILYPAAVIRSGSFSLYTIKAADPILGLTVTVNGVAQVVGYDNVDSAQVDCLINTDSQLLRFFTDNVPAAGAAIVATYRRPVPILVEGLDGQSVRALEELTGETGLKAGRREFYIKDEAITSFEEARNRAAQEVAQYGNPVLEAQWRSLVNGYAPGQSVLIDVSAHGIGRRFLVNEVEWALNSGDDYDYRIRAGSTLLGVEDYVSMLIQAGRKVPFDENAPIEFLAATEDWLQLAETVNKLTTVPEVSGGDVVTVGETIDRLDTALDVSGSDHIEFVEVVDEVDYGPLPPYQYGTAIWGRAIYESA